MTLNNESLSPTFSERFRNLGEEREKVESTSDYFKRNIGQQVARTTETIVGYPGNIKQAVVKGRDTLTDMLGLPNLSELEKKTFGKQEEGTFNDLFFNPPTSYELRESVTPAISEAITGKKDYFESKSKGEEFLGNINQDITSFFLPGTRGMRTMTRLGAPIAGNLVKEGAEYLGVDKENAQKVKLGSMLAWTLAGQSNPRQFANQRIGQAKSMIPDTATASSTLLEQTLNPLYQRLTQGLSVPSKTKTKQGIRDLRNQINNGRINVRSLMDARDNVNEWIAEAGGWDVPATVRKAELANLNRLKTGIIETIDQTMTTRFPQAGELYRTGYEAAAVTNKSNVISNYIERTFGRKAASVGAKVLFPTLATGGAAFMPKTAIAGVALYPIYKTGQVLYRVANSPTLSTYYQNILRDSVSGNAPSMINNMIKLDKELEALEKKDKGKKQSLEDFRQSFKNMD